MPANASVVQYEDPTWKPLLDVVGEELAGWFMWMCELELATGERVHAYKHRVTRRYLHLTGDGRAFAPAVSGHYLPATVREALEELVEQWEELTLPANIREHCDVAIERAVALGRAEVAERIER